MAKNEKEADEVSRQLCLVVNRFLDVSIDYFGSVLLDNNVKSGVRKQKIVTEIAPMSRASRDFSQLSRKLIQSPPMIGRSENRTLIWAGTLFNWWMGR